MWRGCTKAVSPRAEHRGDRNRGREPGAVPHEDLPGGLKIVPPEAGGVACEGVGQFGVRVPLGVTADAVDGAPVGADEVGELASAVAVEDGQHELVEAAGGGVVVVREDVVEV